MMSARFVDYLLFALAAFAAVFPWTGQAAVGTGAFFALAVIATAFVPFGRWQAAPLSLAGWLGSVAGLLPSYIRFIAVLPIAEFLLLGGTFLLWAMPIPCLPKPSGPYAVGLRRFVLPSLAGSADSAFLTYAFFPATPEPGARPRRYHSRMESYAASRAAAALGGPSFLFSHYRLARTYIFENAAIADGASNRPLIVYNHGGVSAPTQNTVLLSELASQGYIVLSIGRPGESSGIAWPDGNVTPIRRDVLERLKQAFGSVDFRRFMVSQDIEEKYSALRAAIPEMSKTYPAEATLHWSDQSIAIVDQLQRLDVPEEMRPIAARVDYQRVGYCGMSLGGSVAHACCMSDERAKVGVNLDGNSWLFSSIGESVPTPFLSLSGDPRIIPRGGRQGDQAPLDLSARTVMPNDFYLEPAAAVGLRADVMRLIIPGATHGDFMDSILAARSSWRRFLGGGSIDSRRMVNFLNAMCVEFFNRYLRGDGQPERVLEKFGEIIRQDNSAVRAWATKRGMAS